jgi:type II restriction enzyme
VSSAHHDASHASISSLHVRHVPCGELERHREAIRRFGSGLEGIEAIARALI